MIDIEWKKRKSSYLISRLYSSFKWQVINNKCDYIQYTCMDRIKVDSLIESINRHGNLYWTYGLGGVRGNWSLCPPFSRPSWRKEDSEKLSPGKGLEETRQNKKRTVHFVMPLNKPKGLWCLHYIWHNRKVLNLYLYITLYLAYTWESSHCCVYYNAYYNWSKHTGILLNNMAVTNKILNTLKCQPTISMQHVQYIHIK